MQAKIVQSFPAFNCFIKRRTTDGHRAFFSDSSKDRRLQSVGPSSISSCERCSADGISASLFHRRNVAFSLTSEINRVSVVAPGIIRCCISHPVARSKSRPGRSLLIQLRVYKKTGKAKCPGPGKFTILIVLTYQRCMLTAGIFPLTVFCKNGDITNPELSGGKMPDAGRNMIHVSKKSAQKTHTPDLQGNTKSIVITPAFPDKFLSASSR